MRTCIDAFKFHHIESLLDAFISLTKKIEKINVVLNNKKIRMPNFPSEILENIVKYVLYKKYKIWPMWDAKTGDLSFHNKYINKRLEVKAFSSKGPSSFGPKEKWNYLYFVDAIDFKHKKFKVYEIKLSNDNDIFSNIKINNRVTYIEQCETGKRPRICFNNLSQQLKQHINIIFDGHLDDLSI